MEKTTFDEPSSDSYDDRIIPVRLALVLALGCAPVAPAAVTFADLEFINEDTLRVTTVENSAGYYVVQETFDLEDFSPIQIAFGIDAPVWDITLPFSLHPRAFYRVQAVSIFSPLDSDGDRIDDVYELNRPAILDPLDPTDADEDPDGNGLTNLAEYLRFLLDTTSAPQFYSRAVTTFNYGAPFAGIDLLSREYTTFNLGSPSALIEANSRLVSLYNGSGPPTVDYLPRVVAREVSIFNFGSAPSPTESISRLISIYNGLAPPTDGNLPRAI